MTILDYRLTPSARVSAGRAGAVGNTRPIHTVIPGSTVRGAIGAAYWLHPTHARAHPDQEEFDALISAMRVTQAVPRVELGSAPVQLQPLSWAECKYPSEELGCGWIDLASEPSTSCPACGGGLKRGRGWTVQSPAVLTHTTRTALQNGVVADGQLFTRQAVRHAVATERHGVQSLTFCGRIEIDGVGEPVREWLTSLPALSIGGQRSTLGACSVEITEADDAPAPAPPSRVALILRSPAIVLDQWGANRPDLRFAVAHLLGEHSPVVVERVWDRPVTVGGWHGVAGMPKPLEWALEAGSVAVLTGVTDQAASILARGIGTRRAEGYGEVTLTAPGTPIADGPALRRVPSVSARPTTGDLLAGAPATSDAGAQPPIEIEPARAGAAAVLLDEPDRLAALLSGLDDQSRAAVVTGLLGLARNIQLTRANGFPESLVSGRVEILLDAAWVRRNVPARGDLIREIVLADDLDATIARLVRLKDAPRD